MVIAIGSLFFSVCDSTLREKTVTFQRVRQNDSYQYGIDNMSEIGYAVICTISDKGENVSCSLKVI